VEIDKGRAGGPDMERASTKKMMDATKYNLSLYMADR
jgi:hypothetical protein